VPVEERVLAGRPDAPWLPPGSRAEVVLAGGSPPPEPVCLVRLLATSDERVLTVPRADGSGLDIPSRVVGDESHTDCLEALRVGVLGVTPPTKLIGYVRNVVPSPGPGYPWPVPRAHFAVWHCPMPPDSEVAGTWLDLREAEAELGERHWWPLVDALPRFR
jgi:hypothetical protein